MKKFGTERNGKVEKITPQKHNLVAVRKKLVMPPRLATVYNPEILHSEETRILMDTGSQEAYITKQETYNWNLIKQKNSQLKRSEIRSQKR